LTPSAGSPSTRPAEHPGWLPWPVAGWLAPPPRRPPLVSVRDGRRLSVRLLPGDPHALLLETEVLCAATAINDEADIAWELFLSVHAVRERLVAWKPSSACARPPQAVARARRESA
jgi:hypothetical protein